MSGLGWQDVRIFGSSLADPTQPDFRTPSIYHGEHFFPSTPSSLYNHVNMWLTHILAPSAGICQPRATRLRYPRAGQAHQSRGSDQVLRKKHSELLAPPIHIRRPANLPSIPPSNHYDPILSASRASHLIPTHLFTHTTQGDSKYVSREILNQYKLCHPHVIGLLDVRFLQSF